jgi:polygalacturonase
MERRFKMKRRKSIIESLAVAATILILGTVAGTLLSVGTAQASQKARPELPVTIAPIKTPFEMPQLKRPSFPDRTFDIRDYGAVQCKWEDEEKHKSTEAIRKAIIACNEGGGGKVLIPRGDWLTGAIHLRSNVNLHIAEGAIVHFSNDLADYLPVVHVRCEGVEAYNYSPLIYAPHVENIAITGRGTLHGHGRWWWSWARNNNRGNRIEATKVPLEERSYGKGAGREGMRPTFIVPWKAKNILIEGITLEESPMWNVHPVYSENIIVRGITVHSLESPNGDGIVPDSCKNVLIEYNHLETGDDAVVIKSGLNEDGLKIGIASENIVVRNFTARDVRTGSGGIVFGSETSGGIRNIYVHDAYFDGCDRGIRFKTTRGRGNVIENIYIKNVVMKNIERQAINFNSYYEREATGKSPLFRNVYINNIRVNGAHTAIEMIGLPEKWLENINVKNAVFENVLNGAIANRVKELTLENISITSKGRPITLDDVFEATIKNVNLSGQRPPLLVGGSESGAITIEGLNPDGVECAKNVPRGAVTVGGVKRP